jgi:large subunit ribosomal protein L14e
MGAIEIGSICLKRKGREAGRKIVVVDKLEKQFVLVDGVNVRRRKCNVRHLTPVGETTGLKKGASHADVLKFFGATEKPKKVKEAKEAPKEKKK